MGGFFSWFSGSLVLGLLAFEDCIVLYFLGLFLFLEGAFCFIALYLMSRKNIFAARKILIYPKKEKIISCKHPPWFGLVPSPPCQAIIPALYDIHNSPVPNAWLADHTLSNRTRGSRAALVHKRLETEAPGQDHHEASADHPRASLCNSYPLARDTHLSRVGGHPRWFLLFLHASFGPREVSLQKHSSFFILCSTTTIPSRSPQPILFSIDFVHSIYQLHHNLVFFHSSLVMSGAAHTRTRTSNQLRMNAHHPRNTMYSSAAYSTVLPADGVSPPSLRDTIFHSHSLPTSSNTNVESTRPYSLEITTRTNQT